MPPASTYRLQVWASFPLSAVASILDYLTQLGAGAIYLSPLLRATSDSEHGYDVVDFTAVDPSRGGPVGWSRLVTDVRRRPLQIVVDIVPNHAGVADASENAAWWDVLRLGRDSPYARWFDIDWTRGRIRLPIDAGSHVVAGPRKGRVPQPRTFDVPAGEVVRLAAQ